MTEELTAVLRDIEQGDRTKVDVLFSYVYPQLRSIAAKLLTRERRGSSMEPNMLVHEVYLKLVNQHQATWKTRSHFFAVGAEAMRRILVDHARQRNRVKHGGAMVRITLTDLNATGLSISRDQDVLDVARLLDKLKKLDARQAKLVELRFFGGLTLDEAAEALNVSRRTVAYEWRMAQAWMRAELRGSDDIPRVENK
ncbi:MAG TPA: ECF-type sigma factor [Bryobacteraceae bacterium]|nr:ECF-type sigma factor [Bryobacteraceae bacterium]